MVPKDQFLIILKSLISILYFLSFAYEFFSFSSNSAYFSL